MSNINYEVLLCMIHMAILCPVLMMAFWVIMRVDRTPQLEFTCEGSGSFTDKKHKFSLWKIDHEHDPLVQSRICSRCGFTQRRKTNAGER